MTTAEAPAPAATREALGPTLIRLREQGLDLLVVDADLGKSTSARKYQAAYPERFFTLGVAEQNMISVAAGMAAVGRTVFASTFAVFVEHAFDQLRISVSQPNLDVKVVASHGGVSVGEDGASAQSVEDLAVMSSLVNFRVVVPADVVEAAAAIEVAARTSGPFYIRTDRPKHAVIYRDGPRFELGRADMLRDGADVTLVSYGLMVERTLAAAELLAAGGVAARVLNMATIRPLDTDALTRAAQETGAIVVAEEHLVHSGLGAMAAQALATRHPVPMEFVGVDDRYGESGRSYEVLDALGLTADHIAAAARTAIARKSD